MIAGRFDEERAFELVNEKFGVIPRPDRSGANKLYRAYTAEPAQDGECSVTLRRTGDTQFVMTAYHVPAGSHQQYAAVDVLSHILGNSPSGRLYKNLVEKGLAANSDSYGFQLRHPALPFAFAEVRAEESLMYNAHNSRLAREMLMRGTRNRSKEEIFDELIRPKNSNQFRWGELESGW